MLQCFLFRISSSRSLNIFSRHSIAIFVRYKRLVYLKEIQGMGFHLKEALLYSPPEPLQHKVRLITIPFLPKSDQHSIPPLNEKCTKDNPEGCTALVAKIKG